MSSDIFPARETRHAGAVSGRYPLGRLFSERANAGSGLSEFRNEVDPTSCDKAGVAIILKH